MPAFTAAAPGKIILFGEHSVVYGRPAIAVPVEQVRARANIIPNPRSATGDVLIQAPDISLEAQLSDLPDEHPLAKAVWIVIHELGVFRLPACTIRIASTIPVASGMGSGAAVSVAVIRAIAAFLGASLPDEIISELVYDVEKIHHGTPSGIDNTVVTYAKPVYYVRGETIEIMELAKSFSIVIANTGIYSPTSVTVRDVRQGWHSNPEVYEQLFDQMGKIAVAARFLLQSGDLWKLGELMNDNHSLLQQLNVSCPELDHLVDVALDAGAVGAKLSGGGRGGNMIALVEQGSARRISEMLLNQGAVGTIITTV